MVGTSKILTVSYGTFSCTLEGFDDPFSTMRSIAEYFRDLAADDRYFGAEPPQPDAEMLHRIAEKEVQRRVEARVQSNGVLLRQMDTTEDEDAAAQEPLPAIDEDMVQPEPAEAAVAEAGAESVAEKLSRIRAVVAKSRDDQQEFVAAEDAPFDEDSEAPVLAKKAAMSDALQAEVAEIDAAVAEEPTGETDDADLDAADHEIAAALDALDAKADEDDGADAEFAEAAKRAFEAEYAAGAEGMDDGEDLSGEVAPEPAPEPATGDWDAVAEADRDEDESDAAPEVEAAGDDQDQAEDLDAMADAEVAADIDAAASLPEDSEEDESEARIIKLKRDDFDAFMASDEEDAETAADAELDIEALDPGADDAVSAEAETEVDEQDTAEANDEDLTAGIRAVLGAAGHQEDADETLADDLAEAERVDAILAERARVLDGAAPEADETPEMPGDIAAIAEEDEDELSPGLLAAQARLGHLAAEDDEATSDVARLMDETEGKMQDSEGSRRRSAIAHLKAAVAATKADRLLKRVTRREANEAEEQEQYREDLSAVVRPKRPEAAGEQSERPKLDEPAAPLMLVSELRIDEDAPDEPQDVRPRRVAADVSEDDDSHDNFAEFAARMDARELPDLLEAAAAYTAFVEGQPHFSRPQLMKRVAKIDREGDFTREAGLRSFGQLLRQGKIQKLKRGQFTIAESTRFNPDARIAGE